MSFAEKIAEVQIPSKLVDAMTTEQLLDAVEKYPMIYNIVIYDSMELALNEVSEQFSALDALMKRKDIVVVCYSQYLSESLKKVSKYKKESDEVYKIFLDAGILLRRQSYKKLDKAQRKNVVTRTRQYQSEEICSRVITLIVDNLEEMSENFWNQEL